MYRFVYSDTLSHHGILGMKWGQRQGPPYPLDAGDHSASERKAGWRRSLDTVASKAKSNSTKVSNAVRSTADKVANKVGLDTEAKRKAALKVGVAIAGTALAAYGVYKLSKMGANAIYLENLDIGKNTVNKLWSSGKGSVAGMPMSMLNEGGYHVNQWGAVYKNLTGNNSPTISVATSDGTMSSDPNDVLSVIRNERYKLANDYARSATERASTTEKIKKGASTLIKKRRY